MEDEDFSLQFRVGVSWKRFTGMEKDPFCSCPAASVSWLTWPHNFILTMDWSSKGSSWHTQVDIRIYVLQLYRLVPFPRPGTTDDLPNITRVSFTCWAKYIWLKLKRGWWWLVFLNNRGLEITILSVSTDFLLVAWKWSSEMVRMKILGRCWMFQTNFSPAWNWFPVNKCKLRKAITQMCFDLSCSLRKGFECDSADVPLDQLLWFALPSLVSRGSATLNYPVRIDVIIGLYPSHRLLTRAWPILDLMGVETDLVGKIDELETAAKGYVSYCFGFHWSLRPQEESGYADDN